MSDREFSREPHPATTREGVDAEVRPDNATSPEGLDVEGAVEVLLKRAKDGPKGPSDVAGEGRAPEGGEPETPSEDETGEDAAEEEGEPDLKEAPDDAVVRVKVGEEEFQLKVADLKRLAGQEAALTRRAQEIARLRREAETVREQYRVALQAMVERAQNRLKQYQGIDLAEAAKVLTKDEYAQLVKDMREAEQEVKFLTEELTHVEQKRAQEMQARMVEAAKECVKALTDPASPTYIPDWGPQTYRELCEFAVSQGVPREVIANEVNPVALRIVWLAMKGFKGQQVAQKVRTKPAQPRRNLAPGGRGSRGGESDHLSRLRETGSVDDAVEVLAARFGKSYVR